MSDRNITVKIEYPGEASAMIHLSAEELGLLLDGADVAMQDSDSATGLYAQDAPRFVSIYNWLDDQRYNVRDIIRAAKPNTWSTS